MKVLLDTQVFLWIAGDWKRVKSSAKRVLQDVETELHLSVASVWEIVIKSALGRLDLPAEPADYVPRCIGDFGISVLDVTLEHALAVHGLPRHHGDPFDRMIIAQAKRGRLTVATSDPAFRRYDVDLLSV